MKSSLAVIALILLNLCLLSQEVSFQEASQAASNFIKQIPEQNKADYTPSDNLIISGHEGNLVYIFNFSPDAFVIVSADHRTKAILGYSATNRFPVDNIPEHVNALISSYTSQIEKISDWNSFNNKALQEEWSDLINGSDISYDGFLNGKEALLRSEWHQLVPYNAMCPEDSAGPGGKTVVGCVALAMAQVLYYHRYPEKGEGEHTYISNKYGTLHADFENTTYQWDEMVNYTYFYPNPAVAQLVFHCGISVEMSYGPAASGAFTEDAVAALVDHFRYSEKAAYILRADTNINFIDSLKRNLDLNRPLIISAGSFGGHSFVCDGYNDNYFHFNFGWGGQFDGYFHLDALTPGGINLTSGQAAIINIIPRESFPSYCNGFKEHTTIEGTLEDGSSSYNYQPNSDCQHLISINENNVTNIMLMIKELDLEENKDFLKIYDGNSTNSPLLASLSGHFENISFTSSSCEMLLHFTSDGQNEDKGWFAEYIGFNGQFCYADNNLSGIIGFVNDRSGKYFYANNSDCNWTLTPSSPEHDSIAGIRIEFEYLSTEANNDFIDIYNGPDASFPLIASLSGDNTPAPITSTSNKVYLNFNSDYEINKEGWSFYYEAVFPTYCNDTALYTAPSGTIGDGSLNKNYINNTDCYWLITPDNAGEITLSFTKFDLEYGYDRLTVYDPTINPPDLLGEFTSNTIPNPVTAKNGKMLLHFKTDESLTFDGWEATYQISNLSVFEKDMQDVLLIPNPASKDFIIKGIPEDIKKLQLDIYDLSGKLYLSLETGNSLEPINISMLPEGLYFVKLILPDQVRTYKLLKTS